MAPATPPLARPTPALLARGLGKSYHDRSLRELLGWADPSRRPWSASAFRLRDVNLEVARGSALGIIGRNGAGKSTLLRLLAGVSRPSEGSIVVHGSVRSLLDLGAGLFDDLTGRENASLAMGLDGLDPAAADRAIRTAFEFAGLGRFVDAPLRSYSSGMRIRLAYALAIAVRPDILVADEVLAVGDEEFQRRCSRHVEGFLESGGTLVLASHSLYLVEKLCEEAVWLDGGRVRERGPTRLVTAAYRAWIESESASTAPVKGVETSLEPGRPTEVADSSATLRLVDPAGETVTRTIESGPLSVSIEGLGGPAPPGARIEILRLNDVLVTTFAVAGKRLIVPRCPLLPGRYRLRLVLAGGQQAGNESVFDCVGSSREVGSVRLAHEWG